MASTRGPVPGRAEFLRGHGAVKARSRAVSTIQVECTSDLQWPEPAESWSESRKLLYLSLRESPMASFYQQSDCYMAFEVIDVLDKAIKTPAATTGLPNQSAITACWVALGRLGVTEGDRRRLSIEIERAPTFDSRKAEIMAGYRQLQVLEGGQSA